MTLGLLALPGPGEAAALFWGTVQVKTTNLGACLSLGKVAMTRRDLTDVRLTSLEVIGQTPGAFVAITCLSSPGGTRAVIMVSSDAEDVGRNVRDALRWEMWQFAKRYQS